MATIVDVYDYEKPYDCEFVSVRDLIGVPIEIDDAQPFTNNKGEEGWYFRFKMTDMMDGNEYYSATHSVGLCNILSRDKVREILASETILVTVMEKEGKNGRKFYTFT